MGFCLKWTGPRSDDLVWYAGHTCDGIFEAKFVAEMGDAKVFDTLEEAREVASIWIPRRGRKPKIPRSAPFEIVQKD